MPFSFETEDREAQFAAEFDTSTSEIPNEVAESVITDLTEDKPNPVAKTMSEVERRLALAECYNLLLQQELFENRTPASVTVQKEIAEFCRRRLENLMGIRQEDASTSAVVAVSTPFPFTKEETSALKVLAQATLKRPGIMNKAQASPAAPPTLKQVTAPPQVAPALRALIRPVVAVRPRPSAPPTAAVVAKATRKKIKEVEPPAGSLSAPGSKHGESRTVKMDLTRQVGEIGNPHGKRMPQGQEMEVVTQQDAIRSVALAGALLPQSMQVGIAHSIKQKENDEE